jgi:hypothetical protein
MLVYPSTPKPNRISPVMTASYKGSRSEFRDGNTQNVRTQFLPIGQTMTLEYQAIQPDNLRAIWYFWDLVGGMYGDAFLLPNSIFYHPDEIVKRIANTSNAYWRFNQESLSMEVVVSQQDREIIVDGELIMVLKGCGIYNVNVELKGAIA